MYPNHPWYVNLIRPIYVVANAHAAQSGLPPVASRLGNGFSAVYRPTAHPVPARWGSGASLQQYVALLSLISRCSAAVIGWFAAVISAVFSPKSPKLQQVERAAPNFSC